MEPNLHVQTVVTGEENSSFGNTLNLFILISEQNKPQLAYLFEC